MRCLSLIPLAGLHALGAWAGRMVYRFDKKFTRGIQTNAGLAGYNDADFWLSNAEHTGRGGAELVYLWSKKVQDIIPKVKVTGWEQVEALRAQGRGILMLTPHMGAFELLSLWIGARAPFVAMYRQPRVASVESIMLEGRERFHVQMATADIKGIRVMLRHLKNSGLVGLLPDQVPNGQGEAVVAEAFGKPAMTMTLPAKLLRQTGAGLVIMFAKRVDAPHGFELYFEVIDTPMSGDAQADALTINGYMERLIRMAPEQYLWNYNRYKRLPDEVRIAYEQANQQLNQQSQSEVSDGQ